MLKSQIEQDLKAAMLARDTTKVTILRTIKGALLNEEITLGVRDQGLDDEQVLKVLARESKRRQEALEIYENAGDSERAAQEKLEKEVIDVYLPAQLSEAEVKAAVEDEVLKLQDPTVKDMGKVIGSLRAQLGANVDGALLARIVKERLEQ